MSTHRFASVGSIVATLAFLAGVAVAPAAHAQSPLPIADIHARLGTLTGTTVTVEGVVTVPINYRGPTTYNGYIQDGSGRGTNLFGGSTAPPNASSLNTVGNRVRVTGEVQVFSNTTVELSNISDVTFVSSGSPVPPIQLSTAAANDARWEGTLIEVSGTIDSISAVVGQARNYYINDGSGRTVARVYNAIGAPQFSVDQHVTARGAGTNFNGLYEFYVGQASDIQVTTPGPDILPPLLVGAWAAAASQAKITFGEAVETSSGGTASNYQIFETANPGNTVAVNSASVSGPVVTLTLGSSLANGTGYTVRVSNVADTEGNALQSPATLAFSGPSGPSDTTPPTLSSASALSLTSVRATFSEAIDPATGGSTANYSVFETANPGNTVSVSSVVVNATTATLTLGSNLTGGTNYTLRAQNIQDVSGNPMPTPQTATFNAPGGSGATPIADIHANLPLYLHQSVTVQGQVYIPTNYRAPATTITGYIQDTSGRGINLFGSTANNPLLQDLGNIVQVTGTVDTFGTTTVEILNLTSVMLISGGNPPLQAVHQTTGQAANARWEGTYVETTGTISSISTTGGSAPATNYTVNDGSGPIVIRVINALGAPTFVVGNEITGRGAGSHFRTDYQILVGKASDVFLGSGGDTTPPNLSSASSPSLTSVRATFSEAIDPTTGGAAANYSVFETANPSNTFSVTAATVTGVTATLTLGSSLTSGTNYTLRAQNIKDVAGNTMPAAQTAAFTASSTGGATPIADIHANLPLYLHQSVTVQGQVYIPTNYRAPATTITGYIQDTSGRGINLFGSTANNPLLQDLGNIVQVTGTVDTFGTTTVEILNLTNVTLISSGNPPLQAVHQTTGQAANARWEGTYVETTGTIASISTTGGSAPATNYTVNDGSGPIVIRVINALGAPTFVVGNEITGRGAGSHFRTDYQILVGKASDVFLGSGGDTTPPNLSSASSPSLTSVRATFSEAIDPTTGATAANYSVFETANPSNTIGVTSAAVTGVSATLTLASSLTSGTSYTLRAQNIKDVAGNTMPAPQTAAFTASSTGGATPIADIHANLPLYLHQSVTVRGQVYIPTNYRAPATTITGYIQDTSGRGINLFGSTANNPLLQDLGNIVQVTGTVDTFGTTTVEILNLTNVTLISSGNPPLQAVHQTTGQAANARWEGTYVETTGTISSISTTGGSAPATNYTVNDGSGPIVIRVINALGAPTFVVGNQITGRGAGSHFRTDYQILVGKASDVFLGSGGDTTPPNLTSATTPSLTSVRATFNEAIDSTTGATAANYSVFETANQSNTIGITSAAVTGVSATLTLASSLTSGTNYSLRAQNVKDTAGNTMPAPQTVTFTASVGPAVLPIAELQNNFSRYKGQQVTVRGQVYIPNNYRGTTASGYIQDESGRGINVFGNAGANNALLQNLGNIVTVTGTADTFFTTNEITNPSATLFSSGNPPLQPVALTTGDAASRAWEGTYILVTGNITAKATTGSPPTAFNYTMDDGSGPIVARVVTALNAPEFNVGQLITARGAGSLFNADYQVLVGTRDGIIEGRPQDTFPPSIVRALSDGGTTLSVEFNEAVTQATAEVAANYEVFRTSNPTQTIAVQSARLAENTRVELSLASALDPGLGFSVRVRHVTDLLGNAIPAAGVTRTVEVAPAEAVSLSGPPFTFLPRQGEAYPLTFTVTSEVAGGSGEVLLRIFDVNGQLKRTLFDSRFDQNAFANNRATRTWDGRDDTQQIVPAGTYVAHLLVTPKRTSNDRQAVQIPVVVATRLDR